MSLSISETLQNHTVAATAINLGTLIISELAGDQLDGNKMGELESIMSIELNNQLLEKTNANN